MKCPRCGQTQIDKLYEIGFTKRVEGSISTRRSRFKRKVCIDCVKWFDREVNKFIERLEKAASFMA